MLLCFVFAFIFGQVLKLRAHLYVAGSYKSYGFCGFVVILIQEMLSSDSESQTQTNCPKAAFHAYVTTT